MHYDILIRGASLVFSSGPSQGDLAVKDGKIVAYGQLDGSADLTIDAKGLHVLPGLIDTQVHFREPGLEHKEDIESGTRSALMGGVTSILEMPNTNPNTISAEMLGDKLRRAKGRAWCDYGFFVGASADNIEELAHLESLPGTPGIKIFMGSSTGSLLVSSDAELRRVLTNGRRRCPIHAEDEPRNTWRRAHLCDSTDSGEHPYLRDAESARLATERILRLSAETGRPVHILHVSTGEEPVLIHEAKKQGLQTTAEVTPQHLYFAAPSCYEQLGTLAQMNPPIRSEEHRRRLLGALKDGVFDVFGSDHAPHTLEEKQRGYPASPSGMPGVQTMLSVLLTLASRGQTSIGQIVRMACENPARMYGIPRKGAIRVGYDADLVLVDAERSYTFERSMVESKCGWSPYEGHTLRGAVESVILGGKLAVMYGERLTQPEGRMLTFAEPQELLDTRAE